MSIQPYLSQINPETHNPSIFQYCPKCGAKALTPQNEQRYECQECQFIYYMNAAGTVIAVIVDSNQRILFTLRAKDPQQGTLDLPGGFIDYYETAETALAREVREEIHLEIQEYKFLFTQPNLYVYAGVLYHTIDFFFLCTVKDFSTLNVSDEVNHYKFLTLDELDLDEIGFQSIQNGLKQLQEHVTNGNIQLKYD